MINCEYGMWAHKDENGDVIVTCDPTINYPLDLELPRYEKAFQLDHCNVNKGQCIGVCPMQIPCDMNEESDPYNNCIPLLGMRLRGMSKEEIEAVNYPYVTNEELNIAMKEGIEYAKTHPRCWEEL